MFQGRSRESWATILVSLVLIGGLALFLYLDPGRAGEEAGMSTPLEPWLRLIVGYLAAGAEIAAALVIGLAVLRGIGFYLRTGFGESQQLSGPIESIRLRLGRALALGLEFTIASDILRTAVAPTRQQIVNLGAIVLLRTLLNHFLEEEIRRGEASRTPA